MIYPAHEGDVQISHVHNAALREEIGERLVISLVQKPVGMPPNLTVLMRQLRDQNPKPVDPNPLKNFIERLPAQHKSWKSRALT
jgi:hypothetical protein